MEIQTIKQYAKLTGKAIGEQFPNSYIDQFGTKHENNEYQIGIELNPLVWYWFKILIFDESDFAENVMFMQRHSQRTGKTAKSWKTGYNAYIKIITRLNKEIKK